MQAVQGAPGRQAPLLQRRGLLAAACLLPVRPASAAPGLELRDALATSRGSLVVLAALADHPDSVQAQRAALLVLPPLEAALPVLGAAAADFAAGPLPGDFALAAFAFLDRADGSSTGGGNRSISIADIERLERLETLTEQTLDACAALRRELQEGRGESAAAAAAGVAALLKALPR